MTRSILQFSDLTVETTMYLIDVDYHFKMSFKQDALWNVFPNYIPEKFQAIPHVKLRYSFRLSVHFLLFFSHCSTRLQMAHKEFWLSMKDK